MLLLSRNLCDKEKIPISNHNTQILTISENMMGVQYLKIFFILSLYTQDACLCVFFFLNLEFLFQFSADTKLLGVFGKNPALGAGHYALSTL